MATPTPNETTCLLKDSHCKDDDLDSLRQNIERDISKHQLSHAYCSHMHYWRFALPQAVLTLISGLLAFFSTSSFVDRINTMTPELITTIAGSLSSVVVFLQTLSAHNRFGDRAIMHETLVINLRNLNNHIDLVKRMKNDEEFAAATDSKIGDDWDSMNTLAKRYQEYLASCNAMVPLPINDSFFSLDSQLSLWFHQQNFDETDRKLYRILAYDILSTEIIESQCCWFRFPSILPSSGRMIQVTIDRLKKKRNSVDVSDAMVVAENRTSCWSSPLKSPIVDPVA